MIRSLSLAALAATLLGAPVLAQSALIEEGDAAGAVGNVTRIDNLTVNDAGDWLVEVDTDNANTDADGALVKNGLVLLQEGQGLAAPAGATLDSFDAITLNNDGNSGWNFFLDGTTGLGDDSGIYWNDQLLVQEGSNTTAAGLSPGTPYTGFLETKTNDAGDVLVLASIDDPAIPSTTDRALLIYDLDAGGNLLAEILVAREGEVLPGQVEAVADFETGPHDFAFNDLGDVMFVADLDGDTTVDGVVYLNDTILAQEGSASPAPGRNWSSLGSAEVDLNDACEWVISGTLDGDAATASLIEKSGAVFRQEGDTLPAISPFLLTSFGTGPVLIANSGDVLWYGDWDDPDTTVDEGLFVNDDLIVQEGVTTIGGVAVDTLRGVQDGFAISPNGRYVVFEAILADGTEGAYLVDRGSVAHREKRNGSGVNPRCFGSTNSPRLGTSWTVEIDTTGHPGATFVAVLAYSQPATGPIISAGELLIDLGSILLGRAVVASSGGVDVFGIPVPNDIALVGMTAYSQAAILGGGAELCNAIDATIGF